MSSTSAPMGRKRPLFRDGAIDQTIVTLKVGRNEDSFALHKDLLCHYSGYFRAALNGSFREAEERVVKLADTGTQTFRIVADWFYTQHLREQGDTFEFEAEASHRPHSQWQEMITAIYIFADRYDVPSLRRDAFDSLHNHFSPNLYYPYYNMIINAFAHLPETSPYLSYIVDLYAYRFDAEDDSVEEAQIRPQLPKEFLLRLMLAYSKRVQGMCDTGNAPYKVDICQYHEHANEEEREACKEKRQEDE